MPWTSACPASRRRSWSTDGKPRSAVARSALIECGLDLLPDAGDHLLGLVTPRLGRPFPLTRLPPAPHRVLHEPRPELLQIGGRKAPPAPRVGPPAGEVVAEAGPRGRAPARA